MNGRRLAALLAAVALIAGAWLIRTRVIDDESASRDEPGSISVICVLDLADVCSTAFDDRDDVSVQVESVAATLDRLSTERSPDDAVWITIQPFPAMLDDVRAGTRLPALISDVDPLGSSPLVLAVEADRVDPLLVRCGTPVAWRCLGEIAGRSWSEIDADISGGKVRPAFSAHPTSAIGQLGVTAAVLGYFDGAPIDSGSTGFIGWTRTLSSATNPSQLGGSTAIDRMQTRASFADIAIGAARELSGDRYVALPPESPVSVDVVAAAFGGSALSAGARGALVAALTTDGWNAPETSNATPPAAAMLTVRTLWSELT